MTNILTTDNKLTYHPLCCYNILNTYNHFGQQALQGFCLGFLQGLKPRLQGGCVSPTSTTVFVRKEQLYGKD